MDVEFDLLGDPIPEGFGRRGRPPHTPTDEKRRIVIQLLAFGKSVEFISAALSITPPTLRKNYFRELRAREEARARVEGSLLSSLMAEAEKGNVSAIDKYFKRLERHDLSQLAAVAANRQPSEEDQRRKVGKKEARRLAAGDVAGIYAPRPAPGSKPN